MRSRLVALTLIASGVLVAAAASADTTLVSQDRRLHVTIDGTSSCNPPGNFGCFPFYPLGPFASEQEAIAPDFAAFDETVSVERASATQSSSIEATHIVAEGTMSALPVHQFTMGGGVAGLRTAETSARSQFSVTFAVDAPTHFVLDGTLALERSGFGPWFGQIELQGPTGLVAEVMCVFDGPWVCGPTSGQVTGELAPGQYTLLASVEASGIPGTLGGPPAAAGIGSYSLDLQLTPAAPVAVPGIGALGGLALASLLATLSVRIGLPRSTRRG